MAEKIDRLTRVHELLKRELAVEINKMSFPNGAGMLVSVTEVISSVDLRNATVGISIFGGDERKKHDVFQELARRRVELQHHLARLLGFKHTPVLTFKPDRRTELGDRVLELLNGDGE